MKRNHSISKIRPLQICVLALFVAMLIASNFWQRAALSANQPLTVAQATPTPFPCQPTPGTCPSSPASNITTPQAPCDVCIPTGFGGNPIAFFDDYSWRTFIALVWPANIQNNQRGVPNTSAGQTVDSPGPRVFETYKALWEVFHQDGSAPAGWNQNEPATVNACGQAVGPGDLVLASFSKFSDLGQAGFGSLVGPLVVQNTTYTSYLTAYNQVEFDQIFNNQWYLKANLPATGLTFDTGSIDVKSAWMEMTNAQHPERYYTRMAWVMNPVTGQCAQKMVGLVGLHIVQKTPTRPQWIWTTFEQVDNVPPAQPGAPGAFPSSPFNYNNGSGTPMPTKNPYQINPLPTPVPSPFNVTRVMPINPSTQGTNAAYQKALKQQNPNSVWQFYQLVMTQWPLQLNPPAPIPPTQSGFPKFTFPGLNATSSFANTTLETFDQGTKNSGGVNVGGTSCMACHTITQTQTDFLWSLADHAFPPKIPSLMMQNESFRALRTIIEQDRKNQAQSAPLKPKQRAKQRR